MYLESHMFTHEYLYCVHDFSREMVKLEYAIMTLWMVKPGVGHWTWTVPEVANADAFRDEKVFKVVSTQLQLIVALLLYGNEAQCCQIIFF